MPQAAAAKREIASFMRLMMAEVERSANDALRTNCGPCHDQAMREPWPVYVFRSSRLAKSETVVTAAPLDLVMSVYGGGGLRGEQGLEAALGGPAYYRDDTGAAYLAVWGARNASRFRAKLRENGAYLQVHNEAPPARLVWSNSRKGHRSKVS